MSAPGDHKCPKCGAKPGFYCKARPNDIWAAKTHIARWRAAGINKPTASDILDDEYDMRQRQLKRAPRMTPISKKPR